MMAPSAKPCIEPLARQDALFQERRQSPRYRLHDLRGTLTWQAPEGEVAGAVTVMNISGGGAAVHAEKAPSAGQAVRLRLHCKSASIEPIEAQALEASTDDSGKIKVRLRFAHWVPLDAILKDYLERRMWQRYPSRESQATLTWLDGSIERILPGELLNISGGGAAFASEVQPPADVSIWLEVDASVPQDPRIDPVESQLVGTSVDPSGRKIAHLQFVGPCPMEFFELTVNGAEWALRDQMRSIARLAADGRLGSSRI
jgi:hypothetical protein